MVDCLDENALQAFFEKRLPPEAGDRVDEHLASCAACRRLLAMYADMAVSKVSYASRGQPSLTEATPPGPGEAASREPDDASRANLGRRIARAVAEKRVGAVLCGKWRVDRLIGIGGMAQVYAATHRNGRPVAIKVLRPELAVEPRFVERFLREGYVANKIEHPGAVAILDDDTTPDGAPFLVMERLEGRTLRERLEAEGPLLPDDALGIAEDVLDVLAAAHARGIVHRDVKPDNLFDTTEGTIKVLDFGIARLRERALGGAADTHTGTTMGTVGYMAPEQARGQTDEIDGRADIWAVGATLYTLLTGKTLHDAPTTNAALLLAMTAAVSPMRELEPELNSAIAALLDTALAFDKAARFKDCRAMADAVVAARRAADVPGAPRPAVRVSQTGTWIGGIQQDGTLLAVSNSRGAGQAPPAHEDHARSESTLRPALRARAPVVAAAVGGAAVALFVTAWIVTTATPAASTTAAIPMPASTPSATPVAIAPVTSTSTPTPTLTPASTPTPIPSPISTSTGTRATPHVSTRPRAGPAPATTSEAGSHAVAPPASLDPLGPRR